MTRSKRDMKPARLKVDSEGCCRACGSAFDVEAAHLVPRSRIAPGAGEDPRNIIPLCGGSQALACHRSFDEGSLDILPFLTRAEQAYAVELVGIPEAYRRLTNSRELAA